MLSVAGDTGQHVHGQRPMYQGLSLIFFELSGIFGISLEVAFLKNIPFNAIQRVEVAKEFCCFKIGVPVCEEKGYSGFRYFAE